jgi:3-hydroxyisobutyrate dehydrogenase-like beta-hydroxyacid dehydrogenase
MHPLNRAHHTIGFVGAGRMGRPMVSRLLQVGYRVKVLVRRAEAGAEVAALGADVVTSLAEVARNVSAVCVCTYDDAQVTDVVFGTNGLLQHMEVDSILVLHTTGSPSLAERIATQARACGVHAVDAPVSGSASDIDAGHLTLLVGGETDVIDELRPVLSAYADPIIDCGPSGSGQRTKLVNNALFAAQVYLADQAYHVAEALGLDGHRLIANLAHGSSRSFAIELLGSSSTPPAALERVRPFLSKDAATVLTLAAAEGIDLGELGRLAAWWCESHEPTS